MLKISIFVFVILSLISGIVLLLDIGIEKITQKIRSVSEEKRIDLIKKDEEREHYLNTMWGVKKWL